MDEEELVNLLIQESLQKAISHFGLEGTEQKIKELYENMPYCRDKLLKEYYVMLGRVVDI